MITATKEEIKFADGDVKNQSQGYAKKHPKEHNRAELARNLA